jgi:hypothetical protein
VPASSLLLACLSPSLRGLLGARGEQEEPAHLSCPDLEAAHLSAFLGGLYAGGKDVSYTSGVNDFLFPSPLMSVNSNTIKVEAASPPHQSVKEGSDEDAGGNMKEEEEDYIDDYKEDSRLNFDSEDEGAISSESSSDPEYEEPIQRSRKKRKMAQNGNTKNPPSRHRDSSQFHKGTKKNNRGYPFYCAVCDCHFRAMRTLENHVEKKHGPKTAPHCFECNKTFETRPKLQYHNTTFHGERLPCPDCGKLYFGKLLKDHIKNSHETCDPKTCEICGSMFTNTRRYQLHVNSHTREATDTQHTPQSWIEKYKANCFCNLNHTSNQSRIEHYKRVHEEYIDCPKCNRLVKDIDERAHRCEKKSPVKKTNEDRSGGTCEECDKVFVTYGALWYHINATHSKIPVPCEICGKLLKSYIHKKDHVKRMHRVKPTCPICGKQVGNLKEHIGSVHTEDSDKKLKCEICGKGFVNDPALQAHRNIHLNLKPYACREGCDMAYSDRSNRNQHERKVHGARGGMHREKAMFR